MGAGLGSEIRGPRSEVRSQRSGMREGSGFWISQKIAKGAKMRSDIGGRKSESGEKLEGTSRAAS